MDYSKRPIITIKNISKTYDVGGTVVKALDNISFEISKSNFLMITGRNGSGKSTLLHQLGLLDYSDSGEIIIDGQDVNKLPEKERAKLRLRKIGYIFQEYALIAELSALENVMLPAMMLEKTSTVKKRAEEFLALVSLKQKAYRLPTQLSGGEQQKVAIARALINHPSIIFADEPTANLDSKSSKDLLNIFQKLNQEENHTIVMVTHEEEELAFASRVIKLIDGRIA